MSLQQDLCDFFKQILIGAITALVVNMIASVKIALNGIGYLILGSILFWISFQYSTSLYSPVPRKDTKGDDRTYIVNQCLIHFFSQNIFRTHTHTHIELKKIWAHVDYSDQDQAKMKLKCAVL